MVLSFYSVLIFNENVSYILGRIIVVITAAFVCFFLLGPNPVVAPNFRVVLSAKMWLVAVLQRFFFFYRALSAVSLVYIPSEPPGPCSGAGEG